ncbi:DeoR family transcriptional regulator [Pseudoduganella sp. FT93W]|uniref:DeoR family transcriptional regulator n=1 Tax=Duganella fentianensis TaxID=2692177 RepID=A0A845HZE4_9BURK|nr:DeoR/GlpR family DNA-binding transcription regulator [Duganella fentianensis]MYN44851.1 DeoR family transcriptional regulator [Duganella fentianensis]
MNEIPATRRDLILHRLEQGEPVNAAALAAEFAVSEDAIRRDLRALATLGLCRRVYGGALPLSPAATPMAERIGHMPERKAALAQQGAALVQPGELLLLDNGSSNLALVPLLPAESGITVATNSIAIAAAVLQRADVRLLMLGGSVDAHVGGCIDATALRQLADLNPDRCFLGACACSAEQGIGAFHLADAHFKQAALAAARHSVVLLTSEKLQTRAPYRVCASAAISCYVLEADAPEACARALEQGGSMVRRASPLLTSY